MRYKSKSVIVLGILTFVTCFFLYSKRNRFYRFRNYDGPENSLINQQDKDRTPLILYWDHPFLEPTYGPKEGLKEGQCTYTYDRSRIREAEAVVFHYSEMSPKYIPWTYYRHVDQVYVWLSMEGPAIVGFSDDLSEYNNFFNWTMTFRRESDVESTYGKLEDVLQNVELGKDAVDELIAKKTKTAIWVTANCGGWSFGGLSMSTHGGTLRMELSQRLCDEGLALDRIGRCFNNGHLLPKSKPELLKETIKKYKFYMSFENALHCHDYITEKFWSNALKSDAVPVVWGPLKENYMRIAPVDSFIHVEDFSTPKKLVEYLQFLDKNDAEYRKYFRWREDKEMTVEKMAKELKSTHPDIEPGYQPKTVCERLLENRKHKAIKNLHREFFKVDPVECF